MFMAIERLIWKRNRDIECPQHKDKEGKSLSHWKATLGPAAWTRSMLPLLENTLRLISLVQDQTTMILDVYFQATKVTKAAYWTISSSKWSSSKSGRRHRLPAQFLEKLDHSSLAGDKYSIFINPSFTEVLCTTTAKAIAMGKWAVTSSIWLILCSISEENNDTEMNGKAEEDPQNEARANVTFSGFTLRSAEESSSSLEEEEKDCICFFVAHRYCLLVHHV